ncbi:MAG: nitrite reductase small subunit NirD [Burkholderiaceae bacterium]
MNAVADAFTVNWVDVCALADLPPWTGVAARLGERQVALFHLPEARERIFAVGNKDPFSGANVLARGIVGDLRGHWMVASPIYKQHFSLRDGVCLEDDRIRIPVFAARIENDRVWLAEGGERA